MHLSLVTLIVPSYDEGIRFFVDGLGWTLTADEDQGRKRWVTVAPGAPSSDLGLSQTQILLAVATSPTQESALGRQTGDRVGFFLQTDCFDRDADRITTAGGTFIETPRHEPYGKVAQWRDPWGNLWDLIEPARA
ncbi:VOC family protein [Gymnodinialimonas hymeniacidonis]|uniref:VOC family protein n=1 Tax=Gymnodinialimonas hymeniacidonis TaxID=3126508 RepID=UPI0034C6AF13